MKTNGNRKWFKKAIDTSGEESLGGWNKTLDSAQRRVYALVSRSEHLSKHEKYISAGRALQALANVTTDKVTKTLATQDAEWFFDEAKKFGEGGVIKAYYVGEDDWSRPLYKSDKGVVYAEVDGVLHYITDEGEPSYPAKNVEMIKDANELIEKEKFNNMIKDRDRQMADYKKRMQAQYPDLDFKEQGGSIYGDGGELAYGEGDILLKDEGDAYVISSQTGKGKQWMIENNYREEEWIDYSEFQRLWNVLKSKDIKVEEFKKGGIPREGAEIGEYYDLRIGLGGDISRKEKINRAIRDLFLRKDGVLDKKIMDDTIKAVGKRNPDYIKVWKEFKKTFSIEDKDGKYINPYLFKKGGNIGSGIIEFMKRKVTFSDFNF